MTESSQSYNILLLTAEFPPQIGGIATLTSQLAEELHGKKVKGKEVKVHVVTSVGRRKEYGFPVTRTPGFLNVKLLKIFPLFFATLGVWLRERPDKLLLGKWTHEGFVAYIMAKVFDVPYVTLAHGSEILKFKDRKFIGFILKKLLKVSQKVIAVSNYTRGLVLELGLPEEKIKVVNNGIKLQNYNSDIATDDFEDNYNLGNKTVLLSVSRLVRRKGHDMVLESLVDIVGSHPDIIYLIAGDGEYREKLELKAKDLGLTEIVTFLGFVDGNILDKAYKASDIFVMPNRIEERRADVEGFGISFLEANLFGLPVIAGRSGGAVDSVIDGKTGFLVDPENVEEIRERLIQLIEDKQLRDKLGSKGRKRVLEQLNVRCQAEEILKELCV